jgi:hypothetical protein
LDFPFTDKDREAGNRDRAKTQAMTTPRHTVLYRHATADAEAKYRTVRHLPPPTLPPDYRRE